jgi:hypothetical protein
MIFEELKGKTILKIIISDDKECMLFECDDGNKYRLIYHQDCCASCSIEDICGDLDDLIGSPLLVAEEVTSENKNPDGIEMPEFQESFTWTFYKLDTIKGGVTIRWYGASNGYYSEKVSFEKLTINGWN